MMSAARLIRLLGCAVLLSVSATQTSWAQSIAFSGSAPSVLVKSTVKSVKVNYSIPFSGIVQVQLFDANWKKVGDKSASVASGSRLATLAVPVRANLPTGGRYILQAVLYTSSWRKLDEAAAYNIKVVDAQDTSYLQLNQWPKTLLGGTTVNVNVVGSASVDTILAIQLFDSRWRKVVGRSIKIAPPYVRTHQFRVPIPRNITPGDRYIWQAFLATRSWRMLKEEFAYNVSVRVGPVPTRLPVTIRRHSGTSFSNAEADRILEDGSRILQTNDGGDDVACAVAPVRSGNVGVFSNGDGSIGTRAEWIEAVSVSGLAKVVDSVDYCVDEFNTSFFGCSDGRSLVIERPAKGNAFGNIDGRTWMHEIGHTRTLPHRNSSSRYIMNANPRGDRINQTECDAFRGVSRYSLTTFSHRRSADDFNQIASPSVEEFVSQHYFDGLPLAQTVNYSSADAGRLAQMLSDENYIQYHENIALTLGMIGDYDVASQLIARIEKGVDHDVDTAHAEYKGRVGAIVGLGYLVHRTGSEKALNYLLNKRRTASWRRLALRTKSADTTKTSKLARQLREYTLMSLGFTGNDVAKQQLLKMKTWTAAAVRRGVAKNNLDDVIGQSLAIMDRVKSDGLLGYYQRRL